MTICDSCGQDQCTAATQKPGESKEAHKERQKLESRLCRVKHKIVVLSGKGGVGKSTTSASLSMGLAMRGYKTLVIDFDIGLRNLDLLLGHEKRVLFDIVNVMNGEVPLEQAVIRDHRCDSLYQLPGSQTETKDVLKLKKIAQMIDQARHKFDYIICDSPAGIEHGARMAMYFADDAVLVATPELPSIRDTDRVIGLIMEKSFSLPNILKLMRTVVISAINH